MILEKLTLKNFRQFQGVQVLEFAEGERNVTVIFGENGRGKTGIFRAIMFCLYGDRELSQDGDAPKEELKLVNTTELDNASKKSTPTVEASVQLEFRDKKNRYTLSRSIRGMIDDGEVLEEIGIPRLSIQNSDGNSKTVSDPKAIADIVNDILDRRVREYFLFDGEKMESLTRATQNQKRQVSKGVRNLLEIDALEASIRAVTGLRAGFSTELANTATGDYARVLNELNQTEQRLLASRDRTVRLDDEIAKASDEKQDVDKKLEAFRDIQELLKRRKALELREQEVKDDLVSLREEIRERTGKSALMMCLRPIQTVFNSIDTRKKKGQIPAEIRRDLIERILAEKKCICGNKIESGFSAYDNIQEWLSKADTPEMQDTMLELWRHLSAIIRRSEDITRETESLLQRYAKTRQEQDAIRIELSSIADSIGTDVRDDALELESSRKKIEKDLIKYEAEKRNLMDEISDLERASKRLSEQKKTLQREEGLRSELADRFDLATDTLQALKSVHQEFTEEAKKSIGRDATTLLKLLLDSDSKTIFSDIVVNRDYSLQITDRWGNPFLANISAGQRQLMSISFIAALARTAAGGTLLEMPLFMDTPFARLSLVHRKNLIEVIPQQCAQWVLLATDTELRQQEGSLFEKGNKLGRFYSLVANEQGATTIQSRNVKEALMILRKSEEETS